MDQRDSYARARRRARAKYGVLMHAGIYAAVMLLLLVINLLTSPGVLWVIWPLMGWGLAVAIHAGGVFLLAGGSGIVDALTEREVSRSGSHGEKR